MLFLLAPIALLLFALYTSWRIFYRLDIALGWKIAATCVLIFGAESMAFIRALSALLASQPIIVLRLAGLLTSLTMVLFFVVFLRDVFILFGIIIKKLFYEKDMAWLKALASPKAGLVVFIIGSTIVLIGVWEAYKVPSIKHVSLAVNNLPKELEDLKIIQLSDLHVGSSFDGVWLQKVVNKVNQQKPDLILITGDMVDGKPDILREDLEPLDQLEAKLGVYYSYGNHDYYSGLDAWIEEHAEQGRKLLINENVILNHNGVDFALVGFPDSGHPGDLNGKFDFAKALEGVSPEMFSIAMAHQPKSALEISKYNIELQLSGHTHGGQVYFVFPVVNWANAGFRTGIHKVGDMLLYVSNGTGLWGNMPIRFGANSEITSISLKAQK